VQQVRARPPRREPHDRPGERAAMRRRHHLPERQEGRAHAVDHAEVGLDGARGAAVHTEEMGLEAGEERGARVGPHVARVPAGLTRGVLARHHEHRAPRPAG
jgi:hypothetical protein